MNFVCSVKSKGHSAPHPGAIGVKPHARPIGGGIPGEEQAAHRKGVGNVVYRWSINFPAVNIPVNIPISCLRARPYVVREAAVSVIRTG